MSPLQEESGCDDDEGEDEEEGREEEDGFDSDESLVDSDSDSDEKGVFLTAAATKMSGPFPFFWLYRWQCLSVCRQVLYLNNF